MPYPITALLIALITALVYLPALDNGFHLDDESNITERAAIRISQWDVESVGNVFSNALMPTRPVANLSFAFDWWRGEGQAREFQASSMAIHATATIAVFALLVLILRQTGTHRNRVVIMVATAAALIWSLHPIQVQAVTYVVQRMATLAALFMVLTLVFYLLGRLKNSWPWFFAAAISFLLALGSKETACATPVLLILTEYAVLRHNQALIQKRLDYFILALPVLASLYVIADLIFGGPLYSWAQGSYKFRDFTMQERLLTQPRVLAYHVSQVFWPLPSRFSIEHDVSISRTLMDSQGTLAALMALLIWIGLGVWFFLKQNKRIIGFFMLWLPATLSIESSFIALEMVFEHRMYLPLLGLVGLLSLALMRLSEKNNKATMAIAILIIAGLAISTSIRLPEWHDSVSLYTKATRFAPESARVWANLGDALSNAGREEEAQAALDKAISLDSTDVTIFLNRSATLIKQGRTAEALADLQRARELSPGNAGVYLNQAALLYQLGRFPEALSDLNHAVRLDPDLADAWFNRGIVHEKLGEMQKALSDYREAISRNSGLGLAHYKLGHLMIKQRQYQAALSPLETAGRLLSGDSDPWFLLAQAHLWLGQNNQALVALDQAININNRDAQAFNLRGKLLARMGSLEAASSDFQSACRLGIRSACQE